MTAPDIVRAGVLDLVPAYWGKPRITSLLVALLNAVQRLEDAASDVLEIFPIGAADLERLRVLGRIVGEPRLDRDLERYRRAIRGRAIANQSRGRLTDLARISAIVLAPIAAIYEGVRSVLIVCVDPVPGALSDAFGLLRDAKPAGVALEIVAWPTGSLTLDGPPGSVTDRLTYAGSGAVDFPLAYVVRSTSW
jgi:hypothetical protein